MNEELEHINQIKENKKLDESLSFLYDKHSRIYYKIIHKYFSSEKYMAKKIELLQECKYHIYFAAIEFDFSKKTKFSSYLANKARWICLNFFNQEKRKSRLEDQPEDVNEDESSSLIPFVIKKEKFKKIFEEIERASDERVAKIFKIRYFDTSTNKLTSWKDVSSQLSLSVQGCINIHNKFLKKLQSKIDK